MNLPYEVIIIIIIFQMTHISAIPLELIMYIFKWVVSMELDMRSLDQLARVKKMVIHYLLFTFPSKQCHVGVLHNYSNSDVKCLCGI